MSLPSTKPYLLRAIHEWCCDNAYTPYISVAVDDAVRVPREYVRDGQIVFNIGYEATGQFAIANDAITFQARFGGVAREIYIPVGNVLAIYAKENGAGMAFEPESESDSKGDNEVGDSSADETPEPPPAPTRPRLQRIK